MTTFLTVTGLVMLVIALVSVTLYLLLNHTDENGN